MTSRDSSGLDRVLRSLNFRNVSALWVMAAIAIFFSLTIPKTFLSSRTWTSMLDTQAVVALAAVALVPPLAAGTFNLAVGTQIGVASMMVGWLAVPLGLPVPLAIGGTLAASAVVGLATGVLIVRFRIDSFIATMGVSSLLIAAVTVMSGGRQILAMPKEMVEFGTAKVFGMTCPFLLAILMSVIVWYVLERTPLGRRVYATGGNVEAARLSGVDVQAMIIGSLVACGLLTGVAGVLVTARLGNADPTIGPAYLLPAFTAAFLGSTQFGRGRFNVAGTFLSVYVLAAGVRGLQLSGAPTWIPDAFNGLALLVAVGLAASAQASGRPSFLQRLLKPRGTRPAGAVPDNL